MNLNIKWDKEEEEVRATGIRSKNLVRLEKDGNFIEFCPVLSYRDVIEINDMEKSKMEIKDGKLVYKSDLNFVDYAIEKNTFRLVKCISNWSLDDEVTIENIKKSKELMELFKIAVDHIVDYNTPKGFKEKKDEKIEENEKKKDEKTPS